MGGRPRRGGWGRKPWPAPAAPRAGPGDERAASPRPPRPGALLWALCRPGRDGARGGQRGGTHRAGRREGARGARRGAPDAAPRPGRDGGAQRVGHPAARRRPLQRPARGGPRACTRGKARGGGDPLRGIRLRRLGASSGGWRPSRAPWLHLRGALAARHRGPCAAKPQRGHVEFSWRGDGAPVEGGPRGRRRRHHLRGERSGAVCLRRSAVAAPRGGARPRVRAPHRLGGGGGGRGLELDGRGPRRRGGGAGQGPLREAQHCVRRHPGGAPVRLLRGQRGRPSRHGRAGRGRLDA